MGRHPGEVEALGYHAGETTPTPMPRRDAHATADTRAGKRPPEHTRPGLAQGDVRVRRVPTDPVTEALGRVVRELPGGGESRPGQLEMAQAVARAIGSGHHLVVQAGTGTGKSLAYLVPAILSGKRVVVSTATKALQDQLAEHDLPLLQRSMRRRFDFAVLKGRSNYLCRQRAAEVAGAADGEERQEVMWPQEPNGSPEGAEPPLGQVRRLIAWGARASTGDRAELDFEPTAAAWATVSVSAQECPGASRCPSGEVCFAEAARRRAVGADVVVVNTHLYGAHLASDHMVLPPHDVAVFDEAHELEDIAAVSLGVTVATGRFRALGRSARAALGSGGAEVEDGLLAAGNRLEEVLLPAIGERLAKGLGPAIGPVVELASGRVERAIEVLRESGPPAGQARFGPPSASGGVDADPARARALLAASRLAEELGALLAFGPEHVAWVEGPARSPSLHLAPIEVGGLLFAGVWSEVTAVLTSATIPAGAGSRLGLPPGCYEELDVGSPFPFETNALLYCPTHLPDRRDPGAEAAQHAEIEALLRAAGGRTLALFTSWRAMERAASALRERIPYRVLTQSDLPKPALLDVFTSDETSCLFATMGFWQGVDVPGRSLSMVVIDRIPFSRPDEPLAQARRDRAGADAFRTVDLPRAAALLAQGAGRLIRSSWDRGVVAVLDPRLGKASYRWDLVRAMPPMRRTKDREEVEDFLSEILATA